MCVPLTVIPLYRVRSSSALSSAVAHTLLAITWHVLAVTVCTCSFRLSIAIVVTIVAPYVIHVLIGPEFEVYGSVTYAVGQAD